MMTAASEQDRIEGDLERTRARMDSRLNELQERLSPGQIVDDLMAYFRGSEGGDFARNLMASVRANPMPAALTGIGLTWLMASSGQPGAAPETGPAPASAPPVPDYEDLHLRVQNAGQEVKRTAEDTDDEYQDRVHDAQGRILGVARQAQETAASFGQRIQDGLTAAKQTATQKLHDVQGGASAATGQISDIAKQASGQVAQGVQAAQRMTGSFITTLSDNPVALGAIGLAVGALLGALVPQSEQEEAALADVAGQARDTAKDLAQKAADAGGQVAQKIVDAGMASAQDHGLTGEKSITDLVKGVASGELAESVKNVAQDVIKSGDEAVRSQGPVGEGEATKDDAAGEHH